MSRYGMVFADFWVDDKVQGWSDRAKLLALYLLTGPHSDGCGVFRLNPGYAAADLGWGIETVRETLTELASNRFATVGEASWIVIRNRLKWDPVANPNVLKSMIAKVERCPRGHPGLADYLKHLREHCQRLKVAVPGWAQPLLNGSETVPEPTPNQALTSYTPTPTPTPTPDSGLRRARDPSPNPATDPPDVERSDAAAPRSPPDPEIEPDPEPEAARPTRGKAYAFDGRVIRLVQADLDRWKTSFDRLDLRAELEALDAWLAELEPDSRERGRWFQLVAGALAKKQAASPSRTREPQPRVRNPTHRDPDPLDIANWSGQRPRAVA